MTITRRTTIAVLGALTILAAAACGGGGSDACALAEDAYAQVQSGATLDDGRLRDTLDRFRSTAIGSMQDGEAEGAILAYHGDNIGNLVLSWDQGLDVQPALAAELANVLTECNSF